LVEGDYSIEWRAAAVTYWTDQKTAELKMVEEWQYSTYGHELGIAVVSAGSECIRAVCATPERFNLPWSASYIRFDPAVSMAQPGPALIVEERKVGVPGWLSLRVREKMTTIRDGSPKGSLKPRPWKFDQRLLRKCPANISWQECTRLQVNLLGIRA